MNKSKGILYAVIASGTFGLIPFFALPLLKDGMTPPTVLFYRNLFCAIILGLFCLLRKKDMKIPVKMLPRILLLSILYLSSSVPLVFAYKYIPSGLATTIHFIYPIGVSLLMLLLFKEQKSFKLFFTAIMSLVGVALLCWHGNSVTDIRGILLSLITVVSYSVYIILLGKSNMHNKDSEVVVFYVMTGNTILLGLLSFFVLGFSPVPAHYGFINLISLSIVSTIVPNVLFLMAVRKVGPAISSILGSMEPLIATLIGIFYFAEPFGWNSVLGFVIIITSVISVIVINNKKEKKALELKIKSQAV